MDKKKDFMPELLLPVGNTESFYAAINGKADAIYLGLQDFNARGRATNFSPWQLAAIVKYAHKNNVKVYITLNTVIRNNEIKQLLNTLFILTQIKPDAVIIQDWGVYYLIKQFFPKLTIHASTQMANHNSAGVSFSAKKGIARVVLARELTRSELESIAKNKKTELEIFVHGALCYSFSGMCLFSSYMGGMGANRGLCTQPCRRIYKNNKSESYIFSLKDNQLVEHLPFIRSLKIDSLKIEGRLKPASYVYTVAEAYRTALANPDKTQEATKSLINDLGREKTDYFLGKNLHDAITQSASTGLLIGEVISIENGKIKITSNIEPENNSRLRFRDKASDKQTVVRIPHFEKQGEHYCFETDNKEIATGNEVYVAGLKIKLPQKIKTDGIRINDRCPAPLVNKALALISHKKTKAQKTQIYLRVDSLGWLHKISPNDFEAIILNLNVSELDSIDLHLPIIQKNKKKIWIELPKFIAENKTGYFQKQLKHLQQAGLSQFSISHLSQKEILPLNARIMANENIYLFNDAAIAQIKAEGVSEYIYPLENDIVNLGKSTDRNGIVPVYFFPHLFYSRMPVKTEDENIISENKGDKYTKHIRDGITIVVPQNPVSLTQYKNKIEKYAFSKYLIDMSFALPSKDSLIAIKNKLLKSESIQASSNFNFKREMK